MSNGITKLSSLLTVSGAHDAPALCPPLQHLHISIPKSDIN